METPPFPDGAGLFQFLEGGNGFGERVPAAPVEEIEIEVVGAEALQAALAGGNGASAAGVGREHLADDLDFAAAALDRLGDDQLGIAIHLGGIEQCHPQIDAALQGGNLVGVFAPVLAHAPGALAEDRQAGARGQVDGGDW